MSNRILIVDDEKFVRELIRDTLSTRGLETGLAEHGREALALMAESVYDLVITDVVMPEMDGFELLKRLKKEYPSAKVVILTGYSLSHDISDFLLYGADEYMTKPFQVEELLATVDRLLEES